MHITFQRGKSRNSITYFHEWFRTWQYPAMFVFDSVSWCPDRSAPVQLEILLEYSLFSNNNIPKSAMVFWLNVTPFASDCYWNIPCESKFHWHVLCSKAVPVTRYTFKSTLMIQRVALSHPMCVLIFQCNIRCSEDYICATTHEKG